MTARSTKLRPLPGDGGDAPTGVEAKAADAKGTAPSRPKRTRAGARGVTPESVEQMRLTADRILVRTPEDRERRSKAGLLIPATAASVTRRCIWSDVVLVGPEARGVRAGDLVLFIPQSGLEVDVSGETFLLLRERDVQAVASERTDPHAGQYL